MPHKQSAGLLMYRHRDGLLEVLLAHPGGPFWSMKDLGAWSIPKGVLEPNEDPLEAAIREFEEETGHRPQATSSHCHGSVSQVARSSMPGQWKTA